MLRQLSIALCLFCQSVGSLACQNNEFQVIESSSKHYQKGTCLTDQHKIHLASEETLTLQAFKDGKAFSHPKKLVGPRDEDSIGKQLKAWLQEILSKLVKRSMDSAPIWKIDVEQDEHFCFNPSTKLSFWRAEVDETIQFTLITDKEYEWNWLVGQHELQWPAEIPIQTGQEYLVKISNRPKSLILHVLPSNSSMIQQAMWMQDQGCLRQAELLLRAEP